jgi:hypothetical protein
MENMILASSNANADPIHMRLPPPNCIKLQSKHSTTIKMMMKWLAYRYVLIDVTALIEFGFAQKSLRIKHVRVLPQLGVAMQSTAKATNRLEQARIMKVCNTMNVSTWLAL